MKKKYYQLSQEQRYQIQALHKSGKTQTYIANQIGCNKSTVSRELKRNVPMRGKGAKVYDAEKAHAKTTARHKQKHKHISFSTELKMQMKALMTVERYSPELVAANWKKMEYRV